MDTLIKLNSQTVGRDKLARLLQYSSRVIWDTMQTRGMSPRSVDKLKSLEYNFGTFRKLLRFGKSIEVLYAALNTIHIEDLTIKLTLTLSKISTSLFLLADHILWVGRSGLATVDANKWANISNRYWLYSILMNLVRDFHEIKHIIAQNNFSVKFKSAKSVKQLIAFISMLVSEHKDVFWDTVKNSCDVWIPLSALGYTKLRPGTIGMLGTVSSIAGIISIIQPCAKLTPS